MDINKEIETALNMTQQDYFNQLSNILDTQLFNLKENIINCIKEYIAKYHENDLETDALVPFNGKYVRILDILDSGEIMTNTDDYPIPTNLNAFTLDELSSMLKILARKSNNN